MRGLAYRRNKLRLKKERVQSYREAIFPVTGARQIGIHARSPKMCSCHMCGNPRKYWKEETYQEKRENCKLIVDKVGEL